MSACYLHQNSSWWEFQAPTSVFKVIKYLCKVKQDLQQIGIQNWSLTQPYYINKTYDMLVGQDPNVNWDKGIWNGMTLPKHKLIAWMIFKTDSEQRRSCLSTIFEMMNCVVFVIWLVKFTTIFSLNVSLIGSYCTKFSIGLLVLDCIDFL